MILYASRNGAVAAFVERVGAAIESESASLLWDLRRERRSAQAALESLEPTRVFVIAPVYAGRIPGRVRRFLELNRGALERHEIALGLSCLYEGEEAREQLYTVYPAWLTARAVGHYLVGGRITRATLSPLIRLFISGMLARDGDVDTLRFELVAEIAAWLDGELSHG